MPTIIENINNIISTKSELKTILTENGLEPSENFNEYPDMFRSIVGSSSIDEAALNGYISSYLDTYSFIDQTALSANSYLTSADLSAYATKSYVADYVASYGGVTNESIIPKENNTYTLGDSTYQYASVNTYSVGAYNSNMYIDTAHGIAFKINGSNRVYIGNSHFRPLNDNLMNLGLSSARWKATYTAYLYCNVDGVSTDIGYYLSYNLSGGNVTIDENIVPKANYTYTLGTSSYIYKTAYVVDLYTSVHNRISNRGDNQMNIQLNNAWRYVFHTNNFSPASDNTINLGASDAQWKTAYAYSLYLNGTDIKNSINGMFSYDSTTGILTITTL